MGTRHFIEQVHADDGELASNGTVLLDQERVIADWYLWKGERPAIHSYAKKQGYVAIRYGDELFELTTSKPTFRAFGIVESKIQQNLTIILEPQRYQPSICPWGVHPDQSRNRLIFTGNGDKGVAMPVSDWALEFADGLPNEILEAIREARGEIAGSIEDDEYRRRLQDRFGSRWSTKRLVNAKPDSPVLLEATIARELEATTTKDMADVTPHEAGVLRPRKRTMTVQRIHSRATPEGPDRATEAAAPVDVPRYRYRPKEEFEKDWHLAMWVPNDPEGPTVVLNEDAPVLLEAIKFQQDQYPDVYAAEVMDIVQKAYGEIAVSMTCSPSVPQRQ